MPYDTRSRSSSHRAAACSASWNLIETGGPPFAPLATDANAQECTRAEFAALEYFALNRAERRADSSALALFPSTPSGKLKPSKRVLFARADTALYGHPTARSVSSSSFGTAMPMFLSPTWAS